MVNFGAAKFPSMLLLLLIGLLTAKVYCFSNVRKHFAFKTCASYRQIISMGPVQSADVVIIGSGPSGLTTAIMLAQSGYQNIQLFDQLPEPPASDAPLWGNFESARTYNIGLSGRGQKVLQQLGVLQRVYDVSAELTVANTWSPKTPLDAPAQRNLNVGARYPTICLERDRLSACLLEEVRQHYSNRVAVHFNTECTDVKWDKSGAEGTDNCKVVLRSRGFTAGDDSEFSVDTSFLIGADGTNSKVRESMSQQSALVKPRLYKDQNIRLYRTVPLHVPLIRPAYAVDGCTYSARSRVPGADINLEALPTKEGVHLAVILFRPNDKYITALKTAGDSVRFFEEHFPMFLPFLHMNDHVQFAAKGDSRFQRFQYVGPQLHVGSSAVLLGDSVHTVKPYFGLGVNSALEDVAVLQQALQVHNCSTSNLDDKSAAAAKRQNALDTYSKLRYPEARALVQMSEHFDKGLIQFLLPLIVDKFLHKKFPRIFSEPILRQLQDERNGFAQACRKKAVERGVQFAALAGIVAVVVAVVRKKLLGRLLRAVAAMVPVMKNCWSKLGKVYPSFN